MASSVIVFLVNFLPLFSLPATAQFVAHPVFDVVVDDVVQFLFREAVVLRQEFVDFVEDGFGKINAKRLNFNSCLRRISRRPQRIFLDFCL